MIYIVLFYLVSMFFSFGISFAYLQRGFPLVAKDDYRTDLTRAMFAALLPQPIGLIAAFIASDWGKQGLKFK